MVSVVPLCMPACGLTEITKTDGLVFDGLVEVTCTIIVPRR